MSVVSKLSFGAALIAGSVLVFSMSAQAQEHYDRDHYDRDHRYDHRYDHREHFVEQRPVYVAPRPIIVAPPPVMMVPQGPPSLNLNFNVPL
jgi:hypothetical protein